MLTFAMIHLSAGEANRQSSIHFRELEEELKERKLEVYATRSVLFCALLVIFFLTLRLQGVL